MTKTALALSLVLLANGCTASTPATQPSGTITTGMPLQAALDALKSVHARETKMDMAPPESRLGGVMTLKCFELADGRAVCFVADRVAESKELAIAGIAVCDQPNKPKAERSWRKVDTLDLRKAVASQPVSKPLTEAEIVAKCREWLALYSAVGLKDAPRKQFSKDDIQRQPQVSRKNGQWRVEFANSKGGEVVIWLDAAGNQTKVEHAGPTLVNEGPAQTQPADAEAAWRAVLAALQAGDKEMLAKVTTSDGYESLIRNGMNGPHKDMTPEQMKSLGQAWAKWEVRFTKRTADAATANLGPEAKEHGLSFVRTEDGWRLDQWTPGD